MMPEYMVPEPWEGWADPKYQYQSNIVQETLRTHGGAFAAYAFIGASDPTNAGDIPFWTSRGFSKFAATGFAFGRGFLIGGAIGYIFDPLDLRPGYDLDLPFSLGSSNPPPADWPGWN